MAQGSGKGLIVTTMQDWTILLVEDTPMDAELAVDLLEMAGFKVIQATSGQEAVDLAAEAQPHLILMDLDLPGMDGLEATRRIKSDPSTAHIPIVALTSSAMKGDSEVTRAVGCLDHMCKPIDTRHFAQSVAKYISGEGRME